MIMIMCYMDTDIFIVQIKADVIYKDIVEGVETSLILQIMS